MFRQFVAMKERELTVGNGQVTEAYDLTEPSMGLPGTAAAQVKSNADTACCVPTEYNLLIQLEFFAEIDLAGFGVVSQILGVAGLQDFTLEYNISAVCHR
jgi:hypothetical protein